jgi:hypothetical protein
VYLYKCVLALANIFATHVHARCIRSSSIIHRIAKIRSKQLGPLLWMPLKMSLQQLLKSASKKSLMSCIYSTPAARQSTAPAASEVCLKKSLMPCIYSTPAARRLLLTQLLPMTTTHLLVVCCSCSCCVLPHGPPLSLSALDSSSSSPAPLKQQHKTWWKQQ